jgi:hypothetical protein
MTAMRLYLLRLNSFFLFLALYLYHNLRSWGAGKKLGKYARKLGQTDSVPGQSYQWDFLAGHHSQDLPAFLLRIRERTQDFRFFQNRQERR